MENDSTLGTLKQASESESQSSEPGSLINKWSFDGLPSRAFRSFSLDCFDNVVSFRSPLHKRIFKARNCIYDGFKKMFLEEVKAITESLSETLEKEERGAEVWTHMTNQLMDGARED